MNKMREEIGKIFWDNLHTVTIAHNEQPNEPHRQVIFKDAIPMLIDAILAKIVEVEDSRIKEAIMFIRTHMFLPENDNFNEVKKILSIKHFLEELPMPEGKKMREELIRTILTWLKTSRPDDSDAPSVLADAILDKIQERLPKEKKGKFSDMGDEAAYEAAAYEEGFNECLTVLKNTLTGEKK